MVVGDVEFIEPHVGVLCAEFSDVGVAIDFNVVVHLDHINAVEHIK